MSKKWLGLHHPETHYSPVHSLSGETTCRECMENCSKPYPCSCCLAEEVKVLRARLTARDIDGAACEWEDTERLDMAGWYCLTHHCRARAQSRQCPLAVVSAENERLQGRIKSARNVCIEAARMDFRSTPIKHSVRSLAARIARVLDGDA